MTPADQQVGPSELQAAGLEPYPAEDFATAGHLSLSPTSELGHHSSQFLRAHVTRGNTEQIHVKYLLLIARSRVFVA